ncbi:MAG: hypothetical protein V3W41_21230 [Planctomycetota bacterium]
MLNQPYFEIALVATDNSPLSLSKRIDRALSNLNASESLSEPENLAKVQLELLNKELAKQGCEQDLDQLAWNSRLVLHSVLQSDSDPTLLRGLLLNRTLELKTQAADVLSLLGLDDLLEDVLNALELLKQHFLQLSLSGLEALKSSERLTLDDLLCQLQGPTLQKKKKSA